MSTDPDCAHSTALLAHTCRDTLGDLVHDDGPLTLATRRGRLICVQEATFIQLVGASGLCSPTSAPTTWIGPSAPSTVAGTAMPMVALTTREVQMLQAIAGGSTSTEIAEDLGLAVSDVAAHLVSIRRRYRVRSTAAAVLAARAEGRIDTACAT